MKSIYEYIDYRKYLKDFYADSKSTKKYFSYRYFARKARLNSPILLKMVIDGKRNLSRKTIDKFIAGINLTEKESVYFRTLVLFNQARSAREKQEHYHGLRALFKMVPQYLVDDGQFGYFDKWYFSVLREGLCHRDYRDDWDRIASCVHPRITATEAKQAVAWLLGHDFLKIAKQGTYERSQRAITTRSEVSSSTVRNFNRKMIQLAAQSLDDFPINKRFATGLTIGVSEQAYQMLVADIEAFRDRVVQFVNSAEGADRVYQMNLQLFPVMLDSDQKDAE
jgi:uncharacterized protein (TIGR02147 family)